MGFTGGSFAERENSGRKQPCASPAAVNLKTAEVGFSHLSTQRHAVLTVLQ